MNSDSIPYHPTPDDISLLGGEDPLHRFARIIHKITPHVYVAKFLVLVNVLVFVAMVASGVSYSLPSIEDALAWGASTASYTMNGQWWRLFTCMFVHFGILHLGLNMWVLWQLGPLAERLMGNVGFLLMYLVSGLIGSLAGLFWNPESVGAGASGAVFGVAGAVLAFTLLQKKSIPLVAFSGIKSSMVAFVGYNMLFGFAFNAAKPGGVMIGMATHTGGLIGGMVCGALLSQPIELAARKRRWWHNLTMLIVGVVAIGCGIRFMPLVVAAPPQAGMPMNPSIAELQKAFEHLNAAQGAMSSKLKELEQQLNSKQIDRQTFASTLESTVIPSLESTRAQFVALKDIPSEAQQQVNQIIKYLDVRSRSLQLAADAVREDRKSKYQEFVEQRDLADRLWNELASPKAR